MSGKSDECFGNLCSLYLLLSTFRQPWSQVQIIVTNSWRRWVIWLRISHNTLNRFTLHLPLDADIVTTSTALGFYLGNLISLCRYEVRK